MATLKFLGAAGTVTGSKYLLTNGPERSGRSGAPEGSRVMVDCGLFQGLKEIRRRNWESSPIEPSSVNAVILTHAHIDHTGYLPRLVQQGFAGKVFATPATVDLCRILLPDSARLQEEEARYANKVGSTRHRPAKPLYSEEDAEQALSLLSPVPYGTPTRVTPDITVTFHNAGHILGSSVVECRARSGKEEVSLLFSGDLGRFDAPILHDPDRPAAARFLLIESTYGNRKHPEESRKEALARVVRECVERKGCLLIPAFAVGRTQEILYTLRELEEENAVPVLPVYVDSPMAIDVTKLFQRYHNEHDLEMERFEREGKSPFQARNVRYMRSQQESKSLNRVQLPAIIISANGMATGGRILHHLTHRLPDPRNLVVFVGYQAEGTRGRRMLEGEPAIKLFGQMIPVRARIEQITSFSAHADADEILRWLRLAPSPPARTFITHGEPEASRALAGLIERELSWATHLPSYLEEVRLN